MGVARRGRRRNEAGPPVVLPLPDAGTVVAVSVAGRSWTTRVEQAGPQELEVVAPTRPRGEPILPDPGVDVRVGWPTELGQMIADGSLAATGVDVVALWRVRVARVERHQRRRSFRLDVSLPMTLAWPEGSVETRSRDLSEHGVGCVLGARQAPPMGAVVALTLDLADHGDLEAEVQVVRVLEMARIPGEPQTYDVGLAFTTEHASRSEVVRRFVLQEQLRRRAVERA